MLFPLSFISAETVEFLRYGFLYRKVFWFLVRNDSILSVSAIQYRWIYTTTKSIYAPLTLIFLMQSVEYSNGRFFFFVFSSAPFRTKTKMEKCLILIWIPFRWIVSFSLISVSACPFLKEDPI